MQTREIDARTISGWGMLMILLAAGGGLTYGWVQADYHPPVPWQLALLITGTLVWSFLLCGFFTLQPNVAAVLLLFGRYVGTAREEGLRYANPLLIKKKLSLRAHNLNGETVKVNDRRGNPVEIAAVVVWRVTNTAQAVFDVEDYSSFVAVQSESGLRHLASVYPYDTLEEGELSLRGSMDEVSAALTKELQERVIKAGVTVDEARLSHLAYAQEIAGAMLQRQQAEAIIAARTRIVDGAVSIVEMALEKLDKHKTIKLDDERRAAMVSNLLVVLCGDKAVHPVVNTGTLYT